MNFNFKRAFFSALFIIYFLIGQASCLTMAFGNPNTIIQVIATVYAISFIIAIFYISGSGENL